jgi:hypothetical protein
VNALASDEVGQFVNKYFVSSFQRVGSFRITQGRKQGGNVATYFCVPDGRVLHAIAGPVDAKALLEEANWVTVATRDAVAGAKGDATRFKELLRKYHAARLEEKYGVRVTPVFQDQIFQDLRTATAYRDAKGRPLAPVLPLPPIENQREVKRQMPNGAKVHRLLAAHATMKIEDLYGAIFEGILGETVTTKPVQADTPFRGVARTTN